MGAEQKYKSQYEVYYRYGKNKWNKTNQTKRIFFYLILACFVYYFFLGSSVLSSDSHRVDKLSFESDADEFDEPPTVEKKKKKKEKNIVIPPLNKQVLSPETLIPAGKYSRLVKPMEHRHDNLVICPNVGGGGKNRQCSKGYLEYYFEVEAGRDYYLYVETIGPNINDNSLWVGTDANEKNFLSCSSKTKAGPLVPKKHIKSSKWLCCPKYLAKNNRNGQGDFYYECCFTKLGPKGSETGCILDLEVDSKPHWNMLPRIFTAKSDEMMIKLYAREDGTAVTSLFLSEDPSKSSVF